MNARSFSGHAGKGDGNEAARLPFEEQQLDGEHDGSKGRSEGGGHPGRRAGHQKRLALRRGEVEELGNQRTNGAARHDDGPFRAEWTTRSDGNRGGDGFQHGKPRFDLGPALENRFYSFRDSV